MVKHILCSLVMSVGMFEPLAYAQSLFSPRSIGIGAYGPLVSDSRSFTDNPAGLVSTRDWDLSIGTYAPTGGGSQGFVFEGVSIGKKLFDSWAAALQYSQGSALEFVIPTTFAALDSSPVSVDKRVRYEEPFAAGIAYRITDGLSVGLAGRLVMQRITDSQYQFLVDSNGGRFTPLPDKISDVNVTTVDAGIRWKPLDLLTVSLVGRNLLRFDSGTFPDEFSSYTLSDKKSLEAGAGIQVVPPLIVSAECSTVKSGAFGLEWSPGYNIALRGGAYITSDASPFVSALAMGAGWEYGFFSADIAYLRFTSQTDRQGTGQVHQFDPASITSIDLNRYTRDRLQLSVKAIFGNVRTSLASIEKVEMLGGIYPSAYESFAYRPVGTVRVKNISDQPIEARARFFVDRYMDMPTESRPVYIPPGDVKEIPLTAVFNQRVAGVERMTVREGNVYVSATPAEDYDDKYATPVLIYGKNDWDGNAYSLRYFVKPDDPAVIRYTRDILLQSRDSLDGVGTDLEPFRKAALLFNAFAGKLVYVSDPKQSADVVQYPSETLHLRGGDCDDMTVCFSSLLNSIGISTAFVDVVPPADSSKSHIYLLFDTGVDPRYGNAISANSKRYIIRRNPKGSETIWVPIETTVITRGFDAAWSQGAREYFDDVELGLGLIKGWVKIVDVY